MLMQNCEGAIRRIMGDVQVPYAKISFHSYANETRALVNDCAPLQGSKNVPSGSPVQVDFLAG